LIVPATEMHGKFVHLLISVFSAHIPVQKSEFGDISQPLNFLIGDYIAMLSKSQIFEIRGISEKTFIKNSDHHSCDRQNVANKENP
jgi:hypothetical protein